MYQRVRIELPEGIKGTNKPFMAHGVKIFIGDEEIRNVTDIVVTYPVNGPVRVDLTILASGVDEGLEFDGMADIEVRKERVEVTTFADGKKPRFLESEEVTND